MRVERASFQDTPRPDAKAPLSDADKKSIQRRMNRMHKYVPMH